MGDFPQVRAEVEEEVGEYWAKVEVEVEVEVEVGVEAFLHILTIITKLVIEGPIIIRAIIGSHQATMRLAQIKKFYLNGNRTLDRGQVQ